MPADASRAAPLVSGDWQIATEFAATLAPEDSARFYAVYEGGAFGHPERGIIAAIARGHPAGTGDGAGDIKGAVEAAQLVIHSFAEGYFGARRTFGAKRAAHLALTSINAWLHGQIRNDSSRHLVPVSLTALLFYGASVGIAQIGSGRAYRRRADETTPLMRDGLLPDDKAGPSRAIGRDLELFVDYDELDAKAGDQFLLTSGVATQSGAVDAAFRLQLQTGDANALLLNIIAVPEGQAAMRRGELADLPLRPAPREGDVWDGFVIGKTVYQGRYTVLKLARDNIENREVVLKIPLPSMLQDEVFSAGFMREAWIGGTVRGNNVARYIELPADRRSSLYLVMPYYRGETLEQRLNRPPLMPLPDGVGIALKLCDAVQDLSAIQIVHRDLKPENIMLLPKNEVKLLDLGLAYLPGIDIRDAVKPGGTLRYMAPELLKGVQANARSEVYALAVTAYRMFAGGAFPFGQREKTPLQRLRPDLPRWLGRIIQKSLSQDPAERFADAGEMAKALHEGLVSGMADEARQSRFHFNRLQVWQGIAMVFAIGFFALLIKVLR